MQIIAVLAWTAAADVGAEDMLALYKEALGSDAQFQAAQSQYESILERVPQSRAALLPALTLDGNTISNNNSSNTFGSQNYNSHGYSVRLTQPLFRWDAKIARDQTLTLVQQAEAELALARQDLILRVSQAYFGVLLAEDALKALQTEKTAVGEEMAAAQRRFEIGTANITDVRDAKSRHDLVTAQEIAAQNELAAKREEIRRITRRQPSSIAPLRGGIQLAGPAPADIDSWVASAEQDGLGVIAGQAALEIARLETLKARGGRYPRVDLTANVGESKSATINTVGTDLNDSSVGVQFSVPLYSSGAIRARQRETALLLDKSSAELDDARRSSGLSARQAYLTATSGLALVGALQEALVSANTALQANRRGLEIGVRANIDLLNAQKQVSETERDLARARYDTLLSLLKLKAAAGRLAETDVREINALLEAK